MTSANGEVAGTVRDVISTFEKGVKLASRIQISKSDDGQANASEIQDLYRSLSLGPVIVQSYFETDSKSFGASYLIGDYQAQNELKDILLQLKNLVGDLQDVLLDDREVDFRELQAVSDSCRSHAGVSLGQLSQRLTQAREQPSVHMYGRAVSTYSNGAPSVFTPALGRSTSRSTHSSEGGRSSMPKTPDPFLRMQHAGSKKQDIGVLPPRKDSGLSPPSTYDSWQNQSRSQLYEDAEDLHIRRPSSPTLGSEGNPILSPTFARANQLLPVTSPQLPDPRSSSQSYGSHIVASPSKLSSIGTNSPRPRYDPDDFSPMVSEQYGAFKFDRDSSQSAELDALIMNNNRASDRGSNRGSEPLITRPRGHTTGGPNGPPPQRPIPPIPTDAIVRHSDMPVRVPKEMYGQKVPLPPRTQSRPTTYSVFPQQSPPLQAELQQQPPSLPLLQHNNSSSQLVSHIASIDRQPAYPVQSQSTPVREDSLPIRPAISKFQSSSSIQGQPISATQPDTSIPIPVPISLPLMLPTDKQLGPFCRGSSRLFTGLPKKPGFFAAKRPVGMTGYENYWRCNDCQFSGPYREAPGPPDKKGRPGKPQPVFDKTIRECGPLSTAIVGADGRGEGSGGIRYRWAFLAKCHVPLKDVPDNNRLGTVGAYACLFCCAEGQARGWTALRPGASDAASTMSGKSGVSSSSNGVGSTPVFGNLQLFMDHLQMHRMPEYWPGPEMLGRMKCVAGTIAPRTDDWEINLLPQ